MKKQLNTTAIVNELRGASAFFRQDSPPSPILSEPEENVNKSTSQQVDIATNGLVDKSTSNQVDKSTNQQVNKPLKRFTTYLTEESIKGMKRLAVDTDKKDYELYQEAVDKFLKKRGY